MKDAYTHTGALMEHCPVCDKKCFSSRKRAKKFANDHFPGDNWSVYQCEEFWHFGHKPKLIQAGKMTRAQYKLRQQRKLAKQMQSRENE